MGLPVTDIHPVPCGKDRCYIYTDYTLCGEDRVTDIYSVEKIGLKIYTLWRRWGYRYTLCGEDGVTDIHSVEKMGFSNSSFKGSICGTLLS